MTIINNRTQSGFALFNLGFRPFFLGASCYSVLVVIVWTLVYLFKFPIPMSGLSSYQWHAHEMIYGYSMAVITGFLLTAVKNWTGVQTIHGYALIVLFSLWLIARILFLFGTTFISIAGIFDLMFMVCLIIAVVYPVIKTKNWRHLGIMSKLLLLAVFNLCFYLGYTGHLTQGVFWGIYGGLYLVIGLILTIGGRVIPFFIERGVGYPVQLYNPKWITLAGLMLFLIFFISELFLQSKTTTVITATGLFVIYLVRLIGWYTYGIWAKPLLWGLFLATLFIISGFLLFALSFYIDISPYLAIHAFSYGGIGIITVAMMARVSLGHTGRNVNEPPEIVHYVLLLLLFGAIIRVLLPILAPDLYLIWIALSQLCWIVAFLLFIYTYLPILMKPRLDGQFD